MSEREDLILVRWQDEQDGGWREGVVCGLTVYEDFYAVTDVSHIKMLIGESVSKYDHAIIYDRHRNERAIVPLSKVTLVEKRCAMCGGEGTIVPGYMQQPIPCTKCECY